MSTRTSTDVRPFNIDRESVEFAEIADDLRKRANASPTAYSLHAYQSRTYGAAAETEVRALACGIAQATPLPYDDAREVAEIVYDEIVDNGESVRYNLALYGAVID